jgi:DNA-binding transcriptional LysR family regulator
MLGCVVAGMGIALIPSSVLTTFPEAKRLSVHRLARSENNARTVLIWRKGVDSANVKALQEILRGCGAPVHRRRGTAGLRLQIDASTASAKF